MRRFCEELERSGGCQDWQVRQAEQSLRIYFVNFLQRTDWHRRPDSAVVDEQGQTNPRRRCYFFSGQLGPPLKPNAHAIAFSMSTRLSGSCV